MSRKLVNKEKFKKKQDEKSQKNVKAPHFIANKHSELLNLLPFHQANFKCYCIYKSRCEN